MASCAFIPVGQWFHPIYVAAGYLQWNKQNFIQVCIDKDLEAPKLPEKIGDHPWYMYVDPALDFANVQYISEIID